MTRRLAPSLLGLLALVAAFAGCGGSGNDAQDVLKETFGKNREIRSGQLGISLGIAANGGKSASQASQTPISLKVTGPFETLGPNKPPEFDLLVLISAAGQQRSMGAVSTGGKGYIRYGGTAYAVPPAVFAQFLKGFPQGIAGTANGNKSVGGLGINPSKWLKDPKLEGDQRIAGVDTRHVSAKIDISQFVGDLSGLLQQAAGNGQAQRAAPAALTAQQKRQLADSIKSATVDVWSGKDDKTLRKMAVVLDLKSPAGQASTAGASGTLSFTVTFSNLNKAQRILQPANAGSYAQLQAKLKQLGVGQLGSSGTSPGTSAQTAGATQSAGTTQGQDAKAQSYTDCISKAGGDVQKAQQCADLLNR